MQYILNVLECISSIFTAIAALMAIFGINKWKHELKWKKRYQLAEQVLALFYEGRDTLNAIRCIGITKEESKNFLEDKIHNPAYVFLERYKKDGEIFSKLLALRYRFGFLFGENKTTPFKKLSDLLKKIQTQRIILDGLNDPQRDKPLTQTERDKKEKAESYLWSGTSEPDPVNSDMDQIITEIEQICDTILK